VEVWATTSLPVPCSPVMSTLASEGPMRAMVARTGCMAGAVAIISGGWRCGGGGSRLRGAGRGAG